MAFATAEQLRIWLGLSTIDTTRADELLEKLTGAAKRVAKQQLEAVTDDSIELQGTWDKVLRLPQRPVTAVSAVAIDGAALTVDVDFTWTRAGKLVRASRPATLLPRMANGYWGGEHAVVTVTYSHGYATIPDDVVGVVLASAARAYTNPAGAMSHSAGGAAQTHGGAGTFERGGIGFTPSEKELLRNYGRRT